ncbi:MAG: MCP four helix bundle domain-containing protein [Candidatus Omnitrophica bacterium]|nr:MCP four helix bundle domain-containing protein [Candidatus Omnitrophota bacterium]
MKIKTKLALGFTAVVSFTVIIAAAGLFSVNKISSNMNDLSENMLPASEAAEHLVIFVWQINAEFKGLMCISSREKAKEAYEKIKFSIKNIKDAAGYLKEKLSGEKKFIAYVNDLEAALKNLEGLNDEIHKLILSKIEIEEKSIKLKDKFVSNICWLCRRCLRPKRIKKQRFLARNMKL